MIIEGNTTTWIIISVHGHAFVVRYLQLREEYTVCALNYHLKIVKKAYSKGLIMIYVLSNYFLSVLGCRYANSKCSTLSMHLTGGSRILKRRTGGAIIEKIFCHPTFGKIHAKNMKILPKKEGYGPRAHPKSATASANKTKQM